MTNAAPLPDWITAQDPNPVPSVAPPPIQVHHVVVTPMADVVAAQQARAVQAVSDARALNDMRCYIVHEGKKYTLVCACKMGTHINGWCACTDDDDDITFPQRPPELDASVPTATWKKLCSRYIAMAIDVHEKTSTVNKISVAANIVCTVLIALLLNMIIALLSLIMIAFMTSMYINRFIVDPVMTAYVTESNAVLRNTAGVIVQFVNGSDVMHIVSGLASGDLVMLVLHAHGDDMCV